MIKSLKIKELRSRLKLSQEQLAEISGVSSRTIWSCESGKSNITLEKLQKIANSLGVPLLSLINDESSESIGNEVRETSSQYKVDDSSKKIPLVNVKAVGGFGNESFSISEKDIEEYYIIPKFKYHKIDFMIEVTGDSMRPRYKSGDIVACRIIKNYDFLQWNRVHVVATREQGIILKRISFSQKKNHISVLADNPEFPPFDIPMSEVTGIALVAGGVIQE